MGKSNLKRPVEPMPAFVQAALEKENLISDYESRPAYQRNDYLLWINSAKRQQTKETRLKQMLEELSAGGVYMNMKHAPSEKKKIV